MHEKNALIAEILELNPSAEHGWLEMFACEDLAHYLEHLQFAHENARNVRWTRRDDMAPIAMRECA
jgi:hypothetical protein